MEERFREKYCRKHAETGEFKPKWFCNDFSFEELTQDIRSELTLQKEKDAEIVRKSDQYLGYKKVLESAADEIIKQ